MGGVPSSSRRDSARLFKDRRVAVKEVINRDHMVWGRVTLLRGQKGAAGQLVPCGPVKVCAPGTDTTLCLGGD